MNICIVTQCLARGDGQGRVNYEVAKEALRRGHQLTLVASYVDEQLQQHSQVRWIEIQVHHVPTAFAKNLLFAAKSSAWIRQHRHELDIVQTNGAATSGPTDVNAVHFVHDSWLRSPAHTARHRRDFYGLYQWLYTRLNIIWEKQSFEDSSRIIAVSKQVEQDLLNVGVPFETIEVIPNGVALDEFYPLSTGKFPDFQSLGLPEEVPLALFVGDLQSSRKNLDTVLKAISQVPSLHLAVVGRCTRSPYPSLAKQLGLEARVHFLGFRRDVADLMRAADLCIFPSRYDPFGMVVLEAMACQLPVITAATVGAADLVSEDCGVVLPDPEDVALLAKSLNILIQDSDRRKRMGIQARSVAQANTWEKMASQYLNIFEEMGRQKCNLNKIPPSGIKTKRIYAK